MAYVKIDLALYKWAGDRGITVLKEDLGVKRRYFYISSQDGETFQVVLEPERDGFSRVDAHLIESLNDETAHYIWEFPIVELEVILNVVSKSFHNWFARRSS